MLRLSDFVVGRKRFHNLSKGLCISASKHRKMLTSIRSSDTSKQNLLLMSQLSDFVACSKSI